MAKKNQNPTLNEADKTANDDALMRVVLEDYKRSRDYVKHSYLEIWEDCWKSYNNIRTRRGYDGVSDDFVPETFTIVESVKANIAGGKPKFNFRPTNEEQEQDTTLINSLLDFYWERNNMNSVILNWVQDMLVLGNGILMVTWEGDYPCVRNIPLEDFFVDPTATHLNRPTEPGYPKYAGRRFLTSYEELQNQKLVNPETGEMENMFKNLEKINRFNRPDDDKTDKERKERFLGSTLGDEAEKSQIEIIEYFTRKKRIMIANGETLIYEGENPYNRKASKANREIEFEGEILETTVDIPEIPGFLPFAILRNYVDSSLFYAKGDAEIILDRQEALNDVSTQKHDNLNYALNNMWQIDPRFKHLSDQIESIPGAVLPIPQGALTALEKQQIGPDADNEMLRIKEEMRRATAADEVIQGASQDRGRVTATEVQTQINQASQRFATKLNTLESEGYAQLARIIFWESQIFLTEEIVIRIVGPDDAVEWQNYNPGEYLGDYEPKVELVSTTKAIQAEEGQKYVQVHQLAANSPYVDQKELMRVYFEKMLQLPKDEIARLIVDPPMMDPMMMGGEEGSMAALPQSQPNAPLPTVSPGV